MILQSKTNSSAMRSKIIDPNYSHAASAVRPHLKGLVSKVKVVASKRNEEFEALVGVVFPLFHIPSVPDKDTSILYQPKCKVSKLHFRNLTGNNKSSSYFYTSYSKAMVAPHTYIAHTVMYTNADECMQYLFSTSLILDKKYKNTSKILQQ